MAEMDLSERVRDALGERDFRILVLEETVARQDARVAELEAALAASTSDEIAAQRAKREQPPGA